MSKKDAGGYRERFVAWLKTTDEESYKTVMSNLPLETLDEILNTKPEPDAKRSSKPAAKPAPKRRKNRMSPEGRKRISEMMKKRWAEHRKKKAKKK